MEKANFEVLQGFFFTHQDQVFSKVTLNKLSVMLIQFCGNPSVGMK